MERPDQRNELMTNLENRKKKKKPENSPIKKKKKRMNWEYLKIKCL